MSSLPFSNNRHKQAILALIVANIIWGAGSPIFKLALQNIPPFTLAFIRFFVAALFLLPLTYKNLKIQKADWRNLILISIFGITINITFFFWGLLLAPSINAPIISSAAPVFIYLFSIFFLHEKNHPKVFLGTLVSLLGVLLIVIQPILSHGVDTQIIGNLFFIIATLGTVLHSIIGKKVLDKYNPFAVTFWSFLIGSLTFFPFFVKEIVTIHPFNAIDERGLLGLSFGILFSSLAAYTLYHWGMKQIEAQEIGVFFYIDPIIAALIAIPLLGEKITGIFLFGSILVFAGIFIAEGRLHYYPFHKLRR